MQMPSINKKKLYKYLLHPESGSIFAYITVFIIFSIGSSKFLTFDTFAANFTLASELGIVAIGQTFALTAAQIDLSVGSIFGIAAYTLTSLSNMGLYPVAAFIIALLLALLIGFINGLLVIKTDIHSFIITLGMMMFLRGALLAFTGGEVANYRGDPTLIHYLGGEIIRRFYYCSIWFIIAAIIFGIILTRTKYGNWVFATGGNEMIARAVGVQINKIKLSVFMISGLLAGLAGCLCTSRLKLAVPTFGEGIELESIAAAVIGGTLLTGGYGTIIGTFLGAMVMGTVRNGLIMMGVPAYWYRAFVGIIIVIATLVQVLTRKAYLRL